MAARNYLPGVFFIFLGLLAVCHATPARVGAEKQLVNVDDNIVIMCYLDAPVDLSVGEQVVFYKRQRTAEANVTETISAGIFVLDPYSQRARVSVRPNTEPQHTEYQLLIEGAKHEDSGEFGCVAASSTDTSREERTSWTELGVKRDVQEIHVVAIDENEVIHDLEDGKVYRFTKRESYKIKCMAKGSIPKPNMGFYLGTMDVTKQLFVRSPDVARKSEDNVGAQDLITYESEIVSKNIFTVDAAQTVQCKAAVEGLEEKTFTFETEFPEKPKIKCEKTTAGYTDKNVELKCSVSVFPELTDHYWKVTGSGVDASKIIRKGDFTEKENFLVEDKWTEDRSGLDTTLVLLEPLMKNHFARTYTIVAENSEGATEMEVILIHDPDVGAAIGGGETGTSVSISLLLIASLLHLQFIRS